MGLITPISGCMKFTDDLAKVGTIIGQVTDLLTAPELSRPETDVEALQSSTIKLHNVHFRYKDTEVLHGIELTFREGTVNALVGPSGSGKSTIAKLIASFWDVNSGSITVGGVDICKISTEHYHRLVAYVSQDNFRFDNTVRENIRMGIPDATDAQVEQAARDCGCYESFLLLLLLSLKISKSGSFFYIIFYSSELTTSTIELVEIFKYPLRANNFIPISSQSSNDEKMQYPYIHPYLIPASQFPPFYPASQSPSVFPDFVADPRKFLSLVSS